MAALEEKSRERDGKFDRKQSRPSEYRPKQADKPNERTQFVCVFCKCEHQSVKCPNNVTKAERIQQLRRRGRCTRCLREGHEEEKCSTTLRACTMCRNELHHQALCPKLIEKVRNEQQTNLLGVREDGELEAEPPHSEQEAQEDYVAPEYHECEGEAEYQYEEDLDEPLEQEEYYYEEDDDRYDEAPDYYGPDDYGYSEEEDQDRCFTGVAVETYTPASRDYQVHFKAPVKERFSFKRGSAPDNFLQKSNASTAGGTPARISRESESLGQKFRKAVTGAVKEAIRRNVKPNENGTKSGPLKHFRWGEQEAGGKELKKKERAGMAGKTTDQIVYGATTPKQFDRGSNLAKKAANEEMAEKSQELRSIKKLASYFLRVGNPAEDKSANKAIIELGENYLTNNVVEQSKRTRGKDAGIKRKDPENLEPKFVDRREFYPLMMAQMANVFNKNKGESHQALVLLDSASQRTYISKELVGKLRLNPIGRETFTAVGFTGDKITYTANVYNVKLRTEDGKFVWVQCTEAPRKLENIRFYEVSAKKREQKKLDDKEISTAELQWRSPDILLGVGRSSQLAPRFVRKLRSGFEIWHTKLGGLMCGLGRTKLHRDVTLRTDGHELETESVMHIYHEDLSKKEVATSPVDGRVFMLEDLNEVEQAIVNILHVLDR